MFSLGGNQRIYYCAHPVNLRKSFDGLAGAVQEYGGAYVTVTGRVRHISVPEKTLVMEDGTVIGFEDIAAISGFQFEI